MALEISEVIEAEPLDTIDGVGGMATGCSIWNKHKYLVYMILIKYDFLSSIERLQSKKKILPLTFFY